MSLHEALHATDEAKAAEILKTVVDNSCITETFLEGELALADQSPLLRGITTGYEELIPRLIRAGFTQEQLALVETGIDIAKVAINNYASSEVPDSLQG